jgi:hypothetical protein
MLKVVGCIDIARNKFTIIFNKKSEESYISAFTLDPLHLYRPSYIVNPDFLLADA